MGQAVVSSVQIGILKQFQLAATRLHVNAADISYRVLRHNLS